MASVEPCGRCGWEVFVEDCAYWEPVSDETGEGLAAVCESCLTTTERRELNGDGVEG